jgi:hypothetical protein
VGLTTGAAILATGVLAAVVGLQLALVAGRPLGRFAWGGEHEVLPARLRVGSAVAAVVLALAAALILARAGLIPGGAHPGVRIGAWAFTGLFALNTLGNLASRSRVERRVMAPATIALVVSFGLVAAA